MAQRIYTSDGLVLRKDGIGETSLSVLVLTKDFGLLRMRAQGARKQAGKLRHALEPMTRGEYSFVAGRYGARLVGAHAEESLIPPALLPSRAPLGNIARLCVRLLPGEEQNEPLYTSLVAGLRFLRDAKDDQLRAAECAIVLGILRRLGYLPQDERLSRFAESNLSEELVAELAPLEGSAIRTINQLLSATGL